jgi:hypothetical protein
METMGELHGMVAEHFIQKIKTGDLDKGDMSAIINFLRNNGVVCDAHMEKIVPLVEANLPTFDAEYEGLRLVKGG